jgi:transcriptional regulator with XRE-family HTH domain
VRLAPSAGQASAPRPPKPGRFERVSSSRFEAAEQELRKLFGRNVRAARHRAGLTQADVANIVDTDSAYIGTIERGDQNVTLSMVLRLAYAVHTDPGALLLSEAAEKLRFGDTGSDCRCARWLSEVDDGSDATGRIFR